MGKELDWWNTFYKGVYPNFYNSDGSPKNVITLEEAHAVKVHAEEKLNFFFSSGIIDTATNFPDLKTFARSTEEEIMTMPREVFDVIKGFAGYKDSTS